MGQQNYHFITTKEELDENVGKLLVMGIIGKDNTNVPTLEWILMVERYKIPQPQYTFPNGIDFIGKYQTVLKVSSLCFTTAKPPCLYFKQDLESLCHCSAQTYVRKPTEDEVKAFKLAVHKARLNPYDFPTLQLYKCYYEER